MPRCFQMTDVKTGDAATFNAIDEKICEFMKESVHDEFYCWDWYNSIGIPASCGDDWQKIRETKLENVQRAIRRGNKTANHIMYYEGIVRIIDFLSPKYSLNGWYERKH